MKSIFLATGLMLLGISAASAIDCGKASEPLDLAICNSPDALKADEAMTAAYDAALKLSTPKQAKVLKDDQLTWLDLRSDCLYSVPDGSTADPTLEQQGACLADLANKRTAYLTGMPAEGPGTPDQLVPVVLAGIDAIFEHSLRFKTPTTDAEKAFNAAVDTELKDVFIAKKDGENSDSFDMTLAYASPELISAIVEVYLDGERYAHPMPYKFSINVGTDLGRRLIMSDMLDDAGIKTIQAACNVQLKDFIAVGTEGADQRQEDVDTMVEHLDLWSFGATEARLTYLDYFTQDSPPECTIGYDVLRPLIKAKFPLPR